MTTSTLTRIRELVPLRRLGHSDALPLVELQATKLLALSGVQHPPVPIDVVSGLPRVQIERVADLGRSGASRWVGGRWVVLLNDSESRTRQRFSLFHELFHVVNHAFEPDLYVHHTNPGLAVERLADYFAASMLMPKTWLKRAYFDDQIQEVAALAQLFDVSRAAMSWRLEQLGIATPQSVAQEHCRTPLAKEYAR